MAHATGTVNRLAGESSPYLLLHQHNPVDWYPWGEEALERARREDKPIFLSVGYSTCYWCHVMERESFSDPETAELMNRWFVNVKLDREERPDLDEVYMAATQILTNHGGWPNSLFLTPDLKPFYAGTYFPPQDRHGLPGFRTVLAGLAEAWEERRADVLEQAEEMATAMRRYIEERTQPAAVPPGPAAADRGLDALAARFDRTWGGFGGAPKFPTPSNLWLLAELAGDPSGSPDGRPEAGEMLAATLDAMARGGIYDQLAGGFHRYATDREWKVPHFEKMLYDNGLLLEAYAREHARTRDPEMARVARETAEFLGREMTSPEGAFWSAIDAETHGHEGAYYVWTREEIEAALGEEDATFLAPILGFSGKPFFEGESYVLHLPERLAEAAERRRMGYPELLGEVRAMEARLLAARSRRERPATDDKVLADWNGTAIAGLAEAGRLLAEPAFVAQAARAADFLLGALRPAGGPLHHSWRGGRAKVPATLGDYAFLVRGLLALERATGATESPRWLAAAVELTEEQMARLRDPEGGYFVAAESAELLWRSKDVFDGAMPAGNGVAVLNLLELAERTGEERWLAEARAALQAFATVVERVPDAAKTLALGARRYHRLAGGGTGEDMAAYERQPYAGEEALEREEERVVQARLEMAEMAEARGPETASRAAGAGSAEPMEGGGTQGSEGTAVAAGWRPFRLHLAVAPGWHLNANPASEEFLVPTELRGEDGLELRDVRYPAGETVDMAYSGGEGLAVYRGEVELTGELKGKGRLVLVYQPCDDTRCLPPVTRELASG